MGWRSTAIGTAAAILLLLSVCLLPDDLTPYYLFLVVPCLATSAAVLLPLLAFRRTRRFSAGLLLAAAVFLCVSAVGLRFQRTLRPELRWALFSHKFKKEVLSQPVERSDELRHVEWDAWGWGPVGDFTAYVVFDPDDSLQSKAHLTNIRGIPGDVLDVDRLGPRWYSVTLLGDDPWRQSRKTVR